MWFIRTFCNFVWHKCKKNTTSNEVTSKNFLIFLWLFNDAKTYFGEIVHNICCIMQYHYWIQDSVNSTECSFSVLYMPFWGSFGPLFSKISALHHIITSPAHLQSPPVLWPKCFKGLGQTVKVSVTNFFMHYLLWLIIKVRKYFVTKLILPASVSALHHSHCHYTLFT